MIDYYVDTTPLPNPIIWADYAPFQSGPINQRNPEREALTGHTAFVTVEANQVDFFAAATGPFAPTTPPISQSAPIAESTPTLAESVSSHTATAAIPSSSAEIDQIAKQRVRLMAAKYASGSQSSEIVARLEILNSRLSERAPRVSKEQVTALEDANAQLTRIRAAREARAKRLGISTEL